jgi:hypothetical protein
MAPELFLLQGKENCSVDVYAYAMIMWELLHLNSPRVEPRRGMECNSF